MEVRGEVRFRTWKVLLQCVAASRQYVSCITDIPTGIDHYGHFSRVTRTTVEAGVP